MIKARKRRRPNDADRLDKLTTAYDAAKKKPANHNTDISFRDRIMEIDPLGKFDPAEVDRVYGIQNSPRPQIAARTAYRRIAYNSVEAVVRLALELQGAKASSDLWAAGQAVVLAAKRGIWIGENAPVSLMSAVDTVRRLMPLRRTGQAADARVGDTGRTLAVRPAADGLRVLDPETKIPLQLEGGSVPDTLYWRQRICQGDVVLITDQ